MSRRRTLLLFAPLLAVVTACGSEATPQTLPPPTGVASATQALPSETAGTASASEPVLQRDVSLPSAPRNAAPATPALLAGAWRIVAEGEESGAVLSLAEQELTIWRSCGAVNGEWNGNALGMFVSDLDGGDGECDIDAPRWLARASTAVVVGNDRLLLDEGGHAVARLGAGGVIAQPDNDDVDYTDEELESPKVTPALRKQSRPAAALPDDITVATTKQLVGTWRPISSGPDGPSTRFAPKGEWSGGDGCNSIKGAWTVGAQGAFLATSTVFTLKACDKPYEEGDVLADATRAGFDGRYLILYDRQGKKLTTLRRA